MSNQERLIYGWDGSEWGKVLIDAAGHLQVDVIAAAAAESRCYGYDTANWQRLAVESAAQHNLRVKLYDGANGMVIVSGHASIATSTNALWTQTLVRGQSSTWAQPIYARLPNADNVTPNDFALYSHGFLYGFDGATWDRLRVATPADAFATPTFALQVTSFLMGYDGGDWNMVRVDAQGHLQADVLSSALPAGAATYGMQNQGNQYIDLIRILLTARLPAALVSGSLSVINNAASEQHVYGYDGANWQTLLVESNTLKNLRVKLYDGANGIDSDVSDGAQIPTTFRGLGSIAVLYAWDGAQNSRLEVQSSTYRNLRVGIYTSTRQVPVWACSSDGVSASDYALYTLTHLYGYNGGGWDRLRTFGVGILKAGKAGTGSTTVRKTGTGAVVAGAHHLNWIHMNPSSADSEIAITDAIAGGGGVIYDDFHTSRDGHLHEFNPPIEFSTGIWIENYNKLNSVVLNYN